MRKLPIRRNFMTVPAALNELGKIELVRINQRHYQLDHAVTKTQNAILRAFGMSRETIMTDAAKIAATLATIDEKQQPVQEAETKEENDGEA